MNWYKKLDTYLLERYPIIWNTNFVWLMLLGLLLHGIFYACGYGYMDLDLLKKSYLGFAFFDSSYFAIYVVLCILALIYFSYRFFTHNPFRHFYKIARLYFLKKFLAISTVLFFWTLIPVSFESGMAKKTLTITSESQLRKDLHAFNLAYPFFFVEKENYDIKRRSYPKPFPLEEISKFEIGRDSEERAILHGIDAMEPVLTLGVNSYQFGIIKDSVVDECKTIRYIDSIVDVSKVYGLAEFSIYNFNETFIDPNSFMSGQNRKTDFMDRHFRHKIQGSNNIEYIENTHKWMLERNEKAIKKAVDDVNEICKRFDIYSNLEPIKISIDVFNQDLRDGQLIFVEEKNIPTHTIVSKKNKGESSDDFYSPSYYQIGMRDFSTILENFSTLQLSSGYSATSDLFFVLFIFSFIFSFILIILKHIQFLSIIIGITISAILAGVYSIIGIVFGRFHNSTNISSLIFDVLFLSTIIVVALYLLRTRNVSKRVSGFAFLPYVLSSGLLLIPFFRGIVALSKVPIYDKCTDRTSYVETYDVEFMHVTFALFAIISFAFYLLKRFHAKPE